MLLVGAILLAIFVLDSPWGLVVLVVAALLEVAEIAVWFRVARHYRIQVGAETLIGRTAVAVQPLRPVGQVRLDGELWRARCAAGAATGDRVRIVGRENLVLEVEPEQE